MSKIFEKKNTSTKKIYGLKLSTEKKMFNITTTMRCHYLLPEQKE
jgi:hypothetical protein